MLLCHSDLLAKNYFQMKKIYFLGALLTVTSVGFSQKTIIVNGGQFGNPNENVKVQVYDPALNTSRIIDQIETSSVQEIIFDGNIAYVAAQDSLVAYDMTTEQRIASLRFEGVSTKSLAILGNEILIGNFYGQSSSNLYIYNKSNLNLLDSIPGLSSAVKSISTNGVFAYVPQNSTTSSFSDTLGSVVVINIPNRTITDTIAIPGYSNDIGEIIENSTGTGLLTMNQYSNSISQIPYNNFSSATNTSISSGVGVGGRSHYTKHNDTLFFKGTNGIAAINMTNLSIIDSLIVDTLITGFSYDTTNHKFYVTQSNFSGFQAGKEYNRNGVKTRDITVGFSPEVVRVYYGNALSVKDVEFKEIAVSVYPNPTNGVTSIDIASLKLKSADLAVIDATGKLIKRKELTIYDNSIDLSDFKAGVYFVLLRSNQSIYKSQIVKY